MALYDFDINSVLEQLEKVGAASFMLLPEGVRDHLCSTALSYRFEKRPGVVNKVRQDMWAVDEFPEQSPFHEFSNEWQSMLEDKLTNTSPFVVPLVFNEMALNYYGANSFGITPHRDRSVYINLICVFNIVGNCRFCICDDREGNNPRDLDARPGSVILLRAPGFLGSDHRPFHFVSNIHRSRMSFNLRQKETP